MPAWQPHSQAGSQKARSQAPVRAALPSSAPETGSRPGSRTSSSPRRGSACRRTPEAGGPVIDVGFGGDSETTQVFRIGEASCAVPGAAAGLAAVHEAYGSLPWSELLQPAIELAREGIVLSRPQAHLHAILDLILRHASEGKRLYSRADGSRMQPGDVLRLSDLGETLSRIATEGADVLYRGDLARQTARDRRRRRREADRRRSRCLPGHLAQAGSRLVSRARGDLEPATVVGRHPDRVRARAARARPRRRAGNRGGTRLTRRGDARADARTRRAVRDAAASRRPRAAAPRRRATRGSSPADRGVAAGTRGAHARRRHDARLRGR